MFALHCLKKKKSSGLNHYNKDFHLLSICNTWRGVSLHRPSFYIVHSQFQHLKVVKTFDRKWCNTDPWECFMSGGHICPNCLLYTQDCERPYAPHWSWCRTRPGCDSVNPLESFVFVRKWIAAFWLHKRFLRNTQLEKLVHLQKCWPHCSIFFNYTTTQRFTVLQHTHNPT